MWWNFSLFIQNNFTRKILSRIYSRPNQAAGTVHSIYTLGGTNLINFLRATKALIKLNSNLHLIRPIHVFLTRLKIWWNVLIQAPCRPEDILYGISLYEDQKRKRKKDQCFHFSFVGNLISQVNYITSLRSLVDNYNFFI